MHQHDSAIGIHMSPPSWSPLAPPSPPHPSRVSQSPSVCSPSDAEIPNGRLVYIRQCVCWVSQVALVVNAEDLRNVGLILGLGRSPGEGHDNPLQYSWRQTPTDRGTWRATVRRVAESDSAEVLHGHTQCICFHATLPICPTLAFPLSPHVRKSVLYVCISITALTIGSPVVPF